ncbi:protein quick-to-court isoform X2 [Cylas formicarius]|uniref:protein quick-to-court isoform X2 n=1 Tax=Cylas formicarius TaxID=197179 RepID=UPI0029584DB0|nr:protein quick-to-court isoform X2 [Cylas formicarius]
MSDTMFTPDSGHGQGDSKIPVPSSPAPLRRHNSLRARGNPAYESARRLGGDQNRGAAVIDRKQSKSPAALKRTGSFMERGERRVVDGVSPPEAPGCGGFNASPRTASARIRSLSLSLSGTRGSSSKSPSLGAPTPNHHPVSPARGARTSSSSSNAALRLDCWDGESVSSVASSLASCDHAPVARNGTTFSGRSMKYVFHCNQHSGAAGDEYLTPTQRAHRQVKKLKCLLHQARRDLDQKDSDIVKLTKEVVELRLYKAALHSPEDKSQSNSSDAVTVRENTSEQATPEAPPTSNELSCSISDSGHFDGDGTNSSIHSQEDLTARSAHNNHVDTADKAVSAHVGTLEHSRLIVEYERRIQELVRTHEEDTYHLRQRHNDKVEELLQRITEINARYWELVPELEAAKEKIRELEAQLEDAVKKLEEQEQRAKRTYLKMYAQGQETARSERDDAAVMEVARAHPNRISVPELLNELQVTKNELDNVKAMYRQLTEAKSKNKIDPEITLQFLRSAVYYFLTDKENSRGHLRAIESILGFSPNEIANIDRALS